MMKIKFIILGFLIFLLTNCSNKKVESNDNIISFDSTDLEFDFPIMEMDTVKINRNSEKIEIEKELKNSVKEKLEALELIKTYSLDTLYENNFISGNFNSDSIIDIAHIVINIKSKEKGVIIIFGNTSLFQVLGAGTLFKEDSDLYWLEGLKKVEKGERVSKTLVDKKTGDIIGPDIANEIQLDTDAIYLTVEESHGGELIYWNGKDFSSLHWE